MEIKYSLYLIIVLFVISLLFNVYFYQNLQTAKNEILALNNEISTLNSKLNELSSNVLTYLTFTSNPSDCSADDSNCIIDFLKKSMTERTQTLNIVAGEDTKLYEGQGGTFGDHDILLRYVYSDHINIVTYLGGTDRALTSSGGKIGETVSLSSVKIKYTVKNINYDRNSANRYAIITFNHLP